jgi:hypothetical protein
MRHLVRSISIVLLAALLLAACSTDRDSKGKPLRWNGSGLEGMTFYAREWPNLTVHYALPTTPGVAEKAGDSVRQVLGQLQKLGQVTSRERFEIWLVPQGAGWPSGLPEPLTAIQAVPAGPRIVVARPESLSANEGLGRALVLAMFHRKQAAGYNVDWVAAGMSGLWLSDINLVPVKQWVEVVQRGGLDKLFPVLKEGKKDDPDLYLVAAQALAALLVDRYGVNWVDQYPGKPEGLTPTAALLWATGARDEAEGLRLWKERMDYLYQNHKDRLNQPNMAGGYLLPPIGTAADLSPIRVQPKLGALPKGPGPNDNYSPHSYRIAVDYDPDQRQVAGTERLTWQNGEGIPIDTLYFNLWPNAEQFARYGGGIQIEWVEVDGKRVEFQARSLDLVVPLGREVQPGERVEVAIRFVSKLPGRLTSRVFGQNDEGRFNLAHWFPILAVLDDRGWALTALPGTALAEPYSEVAHYSVTLSVPKGYLVGATGTQKARREEGDRWIYEYEAPNVRDWVATGGPNVKEHVVEAEGVKIRVIHEDATWREQVGAETARALRLFNRYLGPYPYRELVVTCCAGLEFPGLFYAFDGFDPDERWKMTVYHELGHQWFYGVVGNDQFGEPWLDEGFTTYVEQYAIRKFGLNRIRRQLPPAPTNPGDLYVNSPAEKFMARPGSSVVQYIYYRGFKLLEDLEQLLGEERMGQLLREYVRRYRFKTATTAGFANLAQEVSGRDLSGFFRDHRISLDERKPYRPVLPLGQAAPTYE